jgi:serine/threonine protein kinase
VDATTYGNLVEIIHASGLPIFEYHDEKQSSSTSSYPAAFVTKGDYLGEGAEFVVSGGYLFKNHAFVSKTFRIPEVTNVGYGDDAFEYHYGTSAGAASSISISKVPDQVPIALKESRLSLHKSGNRPIVLSKFLKEIRITKELTCRKNIASLLGVAFSEVKDDYRAKEEVAPTLVFELALSNLNEFFDTHSDILSSGLRYRFAIQICDGLVAVHNCGFVHADVKGSNILVCLCDDGQFQAKLSDFGHSRKTGTPMNECGGTVAYLAPECFRGGAVPVERSDWCSLYGNTAYRDIYGFGLVLWEMWSSFQSRYPFDDVADPDQLVGMKHDGTAVGYLLSKMPQNTPQDLEDIIRTSLEAVPTHRTPLSDISVSLTEALSKQ